MENNYGVDRKMVLTDLFLKFHETSCPDLKGGMAVIRFLNSFVSDEALQQAIDEEIAKRKR